MYVACTSTHWLLLIWTPRACSTASSAGPELKRLWQEAESESQEQRKLLDMEHL